MSDDGRPARTSGGQGRWENGARVASRSSRQRKLERARAERRIARQAHHVRRKRQVQAGIAASLALILIVLGVTWLLGGFDGKPPAVADQTAANCLWAPRPAATASPTSSSPATSSPPSTAAPPRARACSATASRP